jgi:hypothetical protein
LLELQALACTQATGHSVRTDRTWASLYGLRNHLAHSRRPGIDEGSFSFTWARPDSLQGIVRQHLLAQP